MTKPTFLELKNISASYQTSAKVVDSVNLVVEHGQLACLLGPSGCGKTTVLRAISGFQKLYAGQILLDGIELSSKEKYIPPELRNIGMVFQENTLFPHLNVTKNIGFGLDRLKKTVKIARVSEMLELIGLTHLKNKYPHELSGGQRQRVALARALAPQPKLLLLDEPFSSLDRVLRDSLGSQVRSILKQLGMTAIMVTHDHREAFTLADNIAVMANGKILQYGQAKDLYEHPHNAQVASFIDAGTIVDGQTINHKQASTKAGILKLRCGNNMPGPKHGSQIKILIRDEDVLVDPTSDTVARVITTTFNGASAKIKLELEGGQQINCLVNSDEQYSAGDSLAISIDDRKFQYFRE